MRLRSIFYIFMVIGVFILIVFLTAQKKQVLVTPIQLECKLQKETVTLKYKNQFCVDIQLINNSHPTFLLPEQLEYGFKSYNEAFYFEAYNMDDKEVNIETESDYDWNVFNSKMLPFSVGDTLKKTICSGGMYAFQEKGTYKLRFVFNPNKPFSWGVNYEALKFKKLVLFLFTIFVFLSQTKYKMHRAYGSLFFVFQYKL